MSTKRTILGVVGRMDSDMDPRHQAIAAEVKRRHSRNMVSDALRASNGIAPKGKPVKGIASNE